MRIKKSLRSQRPKRPAPQIRFKRPAGAKASTYFNWVVRSRGFVFAAMFIIVAAALLAAREDTPRIETPAEDVLADPIAENRAASMATMAEREVVSATAAKPAAMPASRPEPSAAPTPANPTATQEPERLATVTISGCVENEDGAFRLVDASGEDAPKSRSWKSGFLKKRSASISLEDSVGTLALRSHAGRRVAVTGTLVDREMQARSLRVLGSCE